MHKKVLAIRNEVKNGTVKVPYAQKTLDAIAQYALQNGLDEAKKHADLAFALIPLIDERKQVLLDELDALAFMVAEKQIAEIEKKLIEYGGYDWSERDKLQDDGTLTEHATANGNIFVWMMNRWTDKENKFKVNKAGIVGCDEIFDVDNEWDLADIEDFVDEKNKNKDLTTEK